MTTGYRRNSLRRNGSACLRALPPAGGLVLLGLCGAQAQPPLPPEDRPGIQGTVMRLSLTDGIALDGGTAAPLAESVRVVGAEGLQRISAGDLVDLARDANGLVTRITVLPRLAQRAPLIEVAPRMTASRFWWNHDGRAYPDSFYAAEASVPLQVAVVSLEATVAYLPQDPTDAAEFAVLDQAGTALWSARVLAGQSTHLYCPVAGGTLTLRCRRADGSLPDHTHCIWGSPMALLKELGLISLPPTAADALAAGLDAALKGVDAGSIAVAQPKVVGLSPQIARDLQGDLLVALGRRHPVVGCMPWEAATTLVDTQRKAAEAARATCWSPWGGAIPSWGACPGRPRPLWSTRSGRPLRLPGPPV